MDETIRKAAIQKLFVAFPLGATVDRMDLYLKQSSICSTADLLVAVERLIQTHQTTRAPSVAQLLDKARAAAADRLGSQRHVEIPPPPAERATYEDFVRLRDLNRAGWHWCVERGGWWLMSKAELRRRGACEPVVHPITRSAINAGWLEHVNGKPVRGNDERWDALEHALQEAPF